MSESTGKDLFDNTYIVCGIRVVINTTEERGRRVATDILDEKVTPTRVFVKEVGDVVNEASDDDKGTLGSLFLDCRGR